MMRKSLRKSSTRNLKRKAWVACSRYVRSRAADSHGIAQCVTCGQPAHWKALQAGHAIPGRHNRVLIDLDIIRPQCYRCNVALRGRLHIFAAKLIKENGLAWWERKEFESRGTLKLTRADYEELIERFSL